jgi:hypothetical protein
MRSKKLSVELQYRIVSGEGYQNIYAALKVPKNTVAFINGRSLEPTRLFLELAARPN